MKEPKYLVCIIDKWQEVIFTDIYKHRGHEVEQ
jgi:hypothetical protein